MLHNFKRSNGPKSYGTLLSFVETHQKDLDMSSRSAPGKTPFLNFLAFLLAFGWEGPVIITIGLRNDSTLEILMGLLFAIFFWALFGIKLLSDLVRHILKLKSPEDALAAKPPANSDQ